MCSLPVIEAYDDGYFPISYKGGRGSTYVVGVEVRNGFYPLKIAWSLVRVDMNTTTQIISEISKTMNGSIILLDGITYAGFDVINPLYLYTSTGKGVITVIQYPLNLERIESALRRHFQDWRERYSIIKEVYTRANLLETPWRAIRLFTCGVSFNDAARILNSTCIYSPIPEPLRLAHKVASGISRAFLR